MALDETARGPAGFVFRRLQTLRFLVMSFRVIAFCLTKGRAVRRRYAEAERTGDVIWLDHGPFGREPGGGAG